MEARRASECAKCELRAHAAVKRRVGTLMLLVDVPMNRVQTSRAQHQKQSDWSGSRSTVALDLL